MILIKQKLLSLYNMQQKNKNPSKPVFFGSESSLQRQIISKCSTPSPSVFLESCWGVFFLQNKFYQFLRESCPCSSVAYVLGTSCLLPGYPQQLQPLLHSFIPSWSCKAERIYRKPQPCFYLPLITKGIFKCQLEVDSMEILITGK